MVHMDSAKQRAHVAVPLGWVEDDEEKERNRESV